MSCYTIYYSLLWGCHYEVIIVIKILMETVCTKIELLEVVLLNYIRLLWVELKILTTKISNSTVKIPTTKIPTAKIRIPAKIPTLSFLTVKILTVSEFCLCCCFDSRDFCCSWILAVGIVAVESLTNAILTVRILIVGILVFVILG